MGDQKKKTDKPVSWQNTTLNRPKKPRRKAKPAQDWKNNQRLAYPRLRQEAKHESLGGSPEKQPNQDTIILTKILLLYPRALVNPRTHVRYYDEGLTRVR